MATKARPVRHCQYSLCVYYRNHDSQGPVRPPRSYFRRQSEEKNKLYGCSDLDDLLPLTSETARRVTLKNAAVDK